jgi:hypothetical protein
LNTSDKKTTPAGVDTAMIYEEALAGVVEPKIGGPFSIFDGA